MENVYLNFDVYSPVKGIPGQYHTSDTLVEVPPALEHSLVIQGKCERLADILIEIESTKHQSSNERFIDDQLHIEIFIGLCLFCLSSFKY